MWASFSTFQASSAWTSSFRLHLLVRLAISIFCVLMPWALMACGVCLSGFLSLLLSQAHPFVKDLKRMCVLFSYFYSFDTVLFTTVFGAV
jgi:hypothetical protein